MNKRASILMAMAAVAVVLTPLAPARAEATITDCTSLPNGTACDDGSPCTSLEACFSGICVAPPAFAQGLGSPVEVGPSPQYIATGDWNMDGNLDMAVSGNGFVSILMGDGTGGFNKVDELPSGTASRSIAVGDFDRDGDPDLAVATSGTNNLRLLMGDGTGGFSVLALSMGGTSRSVATGDFDSDGDLDLAIALASNTVRILLGDGSGAFSLGGSIGVGTLPIFVAPGDFDRDGDLDLAVANENSNSVSILMGDGAAGFSLLSNVQVDTDPQSLAIQDFDRDGDLDLAVASYTNSNVDILLGNGAGGFSPAGVVFVGTHPFMVVAGDLDGDSKIDLAVASQGTNNVSVLRGNGSGGFTSVGTVAVGTAPMALAAGDWNGDGKRDLAAGNGTGTVTILLNSATCETGSCLQPSFTHAVGSPLPSGTSLSTVATGDFDRDGDLDLAVLSNGSNSVMILLGNGAGGFVAGTPVATGASSNATSVTVGDWNRDGKLDLAVSNAGSTGPSARSVGVALGDGAGGFSPAPGSPISIGATPVFITSGDLNGDGKLDLVTTNQTDNTLSILLGNGAGGFGLSSHFPGLLPTSIAIGDWNEDGKSDLAVGLNAGSGTVSVRLGDGSGGFSEAPGSPVALGAFPNSIADADLNGDGKLDLAVSSSGSSNVTILLGNGSGGFSAAGSPVAVGLNPTTVVVADLSGDGKLDLATSNSGSNNVTILVGNGSGGFTPTAGSPPVSSARYLAAGDLNRDGRLDLAVSYNVSHAPPVWILLNTANSYASDGTACSDSNACTGSDTCTGGICSGPAAPLPPEVDNVQVAMNGPILSEITWNRAAGSTTSSPIRGLVSGLPVGPGGGDEVCFGETTDLAIQDFTLPGTGAAYWYLVRGDNKCGNGSLGFRAANGVPTVPRVTSTCP